MADSEDMKRLMSGETDLSRCDFREADLSGMDLRDRNFTHSLLNKSVCNNTNFSGSDFRHAQVSFIKAKNANFDNCNLQSLHFGYAELSKSSMVNVSGQGAHFQHAKLTDVDFRGAKFTSGSMDADCELSGTISDNSTDFEGLVVLRALSRHELFKDYIFDSGKLRRKPETTELSNEQPSPEISQSLPHSDGTRFSDGTGYANASDRMVRFDHNDPDYRRIANDLDEAIESLRTTNEHIEDRDSALQALQYARDLWKRSELPLMQAKVGILMVLDDAIGLVKKAAIVVTIEVLKTSIVEFIRRNMSI